MQQRKPILPLDSVEKLSREEYLVHPAQFENEDHEPTRYLLDLLEGLRAGIAPCDATVHWFDDAISRYATGEARDLGTALGIAPAVRKILQHKVQTAHIREALNCVPAAVIGTKARAEVLADEIRRFEARYGADLPPESLPNWYRLRRCLWRARKFGPLPGSWERIAVRCRR